MRLRSLAVAVGILGLFGATAPAGAQATVSDLASNSCSKFQNTANRAKNRDGALLSPEADQHGPSFNDWVASSQD